jgi:hypothetical protein
LHTLFDSLTPGHFSAGTPYRDNDTLEKVTPALLSEIFSARNLVATPFSPIVFSDAYQKAKKDQELLQATAQRFVQNHGKKPAGVPLTSYVLSRMGKTEEGVRRVMYTRMVPGSSKKVKRQQILETVLNEEEWQPDSGTDGEHTEDSSDDDVPRSGPRISSTGGCIITSKKSENIIIAMREAIDAKQRTEEAKKEKLEASIKQQAELTGLLKTLNYVPLDKQIATHDQLKKFAVQNGMFGSSRLKGDSVYTEINEWVQKQKSENQREEWVSAAQKKEKVTNIIIIFRFHSF